MEHLLPSGNPATLMLSRWLCVSPRHTVNKQYMRLVVALESHCNGSFTLFLHFLFYLVRGEMCVCVLGHMFTRNTTEFFEIYSRMTVSGHSSDPDEFRLELSLTDQSPIGELGLFSDEDVARLTGQTSASTKVVVLQSHVDSSMEGVDNG